MYFAAQVTGLIVWALLALVLAWLVWEFAFVGWANAVSIMRWELACMRKGKRKPRWHRLPKSFFTHAWDFAGYRNNGATTITKDSGGQWRGIGDWNT